MFFSIIIVFIILIAVKYCLQGSGWRISIKVSLLTQICTVNEVYVNAFNLVVYSFIFFQISFILNKCLRYCEFQQNLFHFQTCIIDVFLFHSQLTMFLSPLPFSQLNVASYLQMICLTENFRTDVNDFVTLLTANTCDIRKSILFLQFWIKSGGGILEERPLSLCRKLVCYKRNFCNGTLC